MYTPVNPSFTIRLSQYIVGGGGGLGGGEVGGGDCQSKMG